MVQRLEAEDQGQEKKRGKKKSPGGGGRRAIVILFLVTTLLSLALYLKQLLAGGFSFEWPKLGGEQRITIEK